MLKRLQLEAKQPAFPGAAQQLAASFGAYLQRLCAEQQPSAAFEHALLKRLLQHVRRIRLNFRSH